MALTKLTADVAIISKLPTEPNDTGATPLTADQVKAKFDEAAGIIKTYINDTLTEEADALLIDTEAFASAAANSAAAAALSEQAAATSETNAANSEANAASSASAAASSASSASSSASSASASASTATTKASEAAASATNAATSETNAANSATTAQTAQTATESARDTTLAALPDIEQQITALDARVDQIITTPITSEAAAQEVVDARGGSVSLGARLNGLSENFQSIEANESAELGAELVDGTGWTLGANWTGDFATGFIHASGSAEALSRTMTATGTNLYQIEFDVSVAVPDAGLFVQIGNSAQFDLYIGADTHQTIGIKSVSDGNLVITPKSTYAATITNISVKQITGTSEAMTEFKDSSDFNVIEFRNTGVNTYNQFMGLGSGQYNTTGHSNLALGNATLSNNTTGFWNVAAGKDALKQNTVGSRNVAIGYAALQKNISGQRNQAIGSFALNENTTGIKNVAIGSDNAQANTTGSYNVSIGFAALTRNTTGNSNIAIGRSALGRNETGLGSVAVGDQSLVLATGAPNTAIGFYAMSNNVTGIDNTVIGFGAGGMNGTGSINRNVVIGHNAGVKLSTGADNNVLIGSRAGNDITTGHDNIVIGNTADTPSATDNYKLNIGNTIYGDVASKRIGINIVAPDAFLHLPASTTGTPALKMNQGVLLGTPQAGAIEFDGTNLYFTNSSGTRKTLAVVA